MNKIVPNDNNPYFVNNEGDFSGSKFGYYYNSGCNNYYDSSSCIKNKDCDWDGSLCSEIEVANPIDSLLINFLGRIEK